MTITELLERLEIIKDGLSDSDGLGRYGIEGTIDDIDNLIKDIQDEQKNMIQISKTMYPELEILTNNNDIWGEA